METRRTRRLPISSTSKLKIDTSLNQHFNISKKDIKVQLVDISTEGMGILSEYFIPKGIIIELEFKISGKLISAKGEVRVAISGGKGLTRLGIKFINLDKTQGQIINKFVKEYERRAHTRLGLESQQKPPRKTQNQ